MKNSITMQLLLLLVLVIFTTPIYALGSSSQAGLMQSVMHDVKDQTVYQGEKLTIKAHLQKKGVCRDRNIK